MLSQIFLKAFENRYVLYVLYVCLTKSLTFLTELVAKGMQFRNVTHVTVMVSRSVFSRSDLVWFNRSNVCAPTVLGKVSAIINGPVSFPAPGLKPSVPTVSTTSHQSPGFVHCDPEILKIVI